MNNMIFVGLDVHKATIAIADAQTGLFHPTQTQEDQPDGSLIARFRVGGLCEMCWYLLTWGGRIEVLEPEELRDRMSTLPNISRRRTSP